MAEPFRPMTQETAREYFQYVGTLARELPTKKARRQFFVEEKKQPEYKQAWHALNHREQVSPTKREGYATSLIASSVSNEERILFSRAAQEIGVSRSEFIRIAGVILAKQILKEGGRDAVIALSKDLQVEAKALDSKVLRPDGRKERTIMTQQAIRSFVMSCDTPPTRREIAKATGLSYVHVSNTLLNMEDKIEVDLDTRGTHGNRAKGIRFIEPEETPKQVPLPDQADIFSAKADQTGTDK